MSIKKEFADLVSLDNKKSFFLFAGAGTGKTYTLVELLKIIRENYSEYFRLTSKHCAVITYTNAATDEIINRLKDTSIFDISTIHSFIWSLIKPFQKDIKNTYITFKNQKLAETEEKLKKARPNTKSRKKYEEQEEGIIAEIEFAKSVEEFVYDPNGENLERNSLNHSDVLKIGSYLIANKALMQEVLIGAYPILLIDEGQDTNKKVIDAFIEVQNKHQENFKLGILGDTKQRIYLDGEENIEGKLSEKWQKDHLDINFRSDSRIVELSNSIASRLYPDASVRPKEGVKTGFVHLFIKGYSKDLDRIEIGTRVKEYMARVSNDNEWTKGDVETLLLEHRMAAVRLGFADLYDNLRNVPKYSQGILDGSMSDMFLFKSILVPLENSYTQHDLSEVYQIVKDNSPLLRKDTLSKDESPLKLIQTINLKVQELCKLLCRDDTTIGTVVEFISNNGLFNISPVLKESIKEINGDSEEKEIVAWRKCMSLRYSEVRQYIKYVTGQSGFATHQGVKGLEYDRVMVIIDSQDTKGFLFDYDKLFGVKPLSETDIKNMNEGLDNSIARTMRLFYVVCTRARHSLAILAYTTNPAIVKKTCEENGWFKKDEITIME
jgi:DNA helicase-2/ATP-dependent DNA helicase PcrA